MNISIESNARELQKKLSFFQKKQLGRATNDAINKTLFGLRKEMMKQFYLSAKKMSEFSSIHYKIYG